MLSGRSRKSLSVKQIMDQTSSKGSTKEREVGKGAMKPAMSTDGKTLQE